MKKKIKTNNSEIWIEGGIIMIRMWGELNEKSTKVQIKEIKNLRKESGNIKYVIVDISDLKKVSLKARRIFASEYSGSGVRKIGVICKNPLSKTIASFFLGINKPAILIKLFEDVEEAKKWLREDEY